MTKAEPLPPQIGLSSAPLEPATIRALRKNPDFAPGGVSHATVIRNSLPFVYGTAAALLPGHPEAIARVVTAVFEAFAFRWKRFSRKTLLPVWFLRTTWFTAVRERRRLGIVGFPTLTSEARTNLLLREIFRLKPKLQHPVIIRFVLAAANDSVATVLKVRPHRLEKRAAKGLAILSKRLRKRKISEAPEVLLASICAAVPAEIESSVLNRMANWTRRERPTDLVKGTFRSWQWAIAAARLKRLLRAFACAVCVIVVLAATIAWFYHHGYLMSWLIRNSSRDLAKQIPGLAQPGRPFPAASGTPQTPQELYSLTNIWPAKFTFTEKQWAAMQPSRVEPARNNREGGGFPLRNPKAKRSGLSGVIGIEFNWSEANVEFAGVTFTNAAVRFRGNGTYINSLYGPKQPFKVDLNKKDKKQNIAGIKSLNFVNSIPDNSYVHDALGEKLFRTLGTPGPRTAYAYLTIDVPKEFPNRALGLYVLVENIDAEYAADRFGDKKTPIFKPVTYKLFSDLGDNWSDYSAIYDLKTKGTPEQLQRVVDFAKLVSHATDEEFARRLPGFLNIEEYASFVAGHVLMASYDGYLANGQNFYMYLDPRSSKFGFIPWDQDHGWGEFGYVGNTFQRENASIWHPAAGENRFLDRVLKVESFREIYRAKLENALAHEFTITNLFAEVDHLAAIIRPAVAAESDFRLKRFDQAVSDQWLPGPRDGNGNQEGPRAPVHQIKRFITNRIQSLRDQLDGKSEGVRIQRMNF